MYEKHPEHLACIEQKIKAATAAWVACGYPALELAFQNQIWMLRSQPAQAGGRGGRGARLAALESIKDSKSFCSHELNKPTAYQCQQVFAAVSSLGLTKLSLVLIELLQHEAARF